MNALEWRFYIYPSRQIYFYAASTHKSRIRISVPSDANRCRHTIKK
jgi:hypothetical protein